MMSFPVQDKYWADTLEFIKPHVSNGEIITAPDDFRDEMDAGAFFPYTTLGYMKPALNWAILHKGQLDDIEPQILQDLMASLKPVFANEVFVVYARRPDLPAVDFRNPHLASLLKIVKQFCNSDGKGVDTNQEGNFVSRGIKTRLLGIPRNTALPVHPGSFQKMLVGEDIYRMQMDLYQHGVKSPVFHSSLSAVTSAAHGATQSCYVGQNTALCRVLGKYLLYVDSQETGIAPHLMMDGYWEIWNTIVMRNQLRKGMHCIDVGANHGYYSLIMAAMAGPTGRVASVEPHPRLLSLLERSMEVNGFLYNPVTLVPKAASASSGEKLKLLTIHGKSMNASVRNDLLNDAGLVVCETMSISLDDLTAEWPRVDLIKIDAEGAEEAIWEGMQQLIRRNPSLIIIMEINCARYGNPRGFLDRINRAYQLRHIDFDAKVKNLDVEECLREKPATDRMLYLSKGDPRG
jgi:FkbM family methyltransferase